MRRLIPQQEDYDVIVVLLLSRKIDKVASHNDVTYDGLRLCAAYTEDMAALQSVPFRHRPWFNLVYKIGVVIKGVDGLIELVLGLAIWLTPHLVHRVLTALLGELGEHQTHVFSLVAEYVARVDLQVTHASLAFLVLFLIAHGAIKLALVYCLLRKIIYAYPIALGVLVLFLLHQAFVLVVQPSVGVAILMVLDLLIIWLVWGEYRDLREEE